MPITKGSGNPYWSRDETILALDLLYRHGAPVDRRHDDVTDLSTLLRDAQIHPYEKRKENFRNTDGVALKLQNLLSAIESGRGLSSSKTDRSLVAEFPRERSSDLAKIAAVIRQEIATAKVTPDVEVDEVFVEGQVVTAAHRQRDYRVRVKLFRSRPNLHLKCELCDFSPPPIERALQESFFEAHHIVPLAQASGLRSTRLQDIALLCAGCHRFIHKLIAKQKQWISVSDARSMLHQGNI